MTQRGGSLSAVVTGSLSLDTDQWFAAQARFQGSGGLSFDAEIPSSAVTYSVEATFAGVGGISIYVGLPVSLDYLRPDVDDTDGGWTNELDGTSLVPSIDESVFDDADYIKSSANPVADICRFRLSNPPSGATGPAKVRIRYKRIGVGPIDLIARLQQGASDIAEWVYSGIANTFVTAEETLTAPQLASITDFNDLFIELQADMSSEVGAAYVYRDTQIAEVSGITFNFTVDIGNASPDRLVIVACIGQNGVVGGATIVINGVTLDVDIATANSPTFCSGIVPTGDGNQTISYSWVGTGGFATKGISVWTVTGLVSTAVKKTLDLNGSIAVVAGDFLFGVNIDTAPRDWSGSEVLPDAAHFAVAAGFHINSADWTIASNDAAFSIVSGGSFGGVAATYGEWTPLDLPDLLAWYDASNGVYSDAGVTPAVNNDGAQQWNDLSGHGYHYKQATSGNRPVWKSAGFNGSKPTLQFTAASSQNFLTDFGVAAGTLLLTSGAFVGQLSPSSNNYARAFSYAAGGNPDQSDGMIWALKNAANQELASYRGGFLGVQSIVYDTPLRWFSITDGVNTTTYLNDGAGVPSANTNPTSTGGKLGCGIAIEGAEYWDGLISEIVITKGALSDDDRERLQAYFSAKWELQRAVRIDANPGTSQRSSTGVTSYTYTGLTTTRLADAIVVLINLELAPGASVTSVTWDAAGANQAMTYLGVSQNGTGSGQSHLEVWALLAPASYGNKNIDVVWSGSTQIMMSAVSLRGVNQSSIGAAFTAVASSVSAGTPSFNVSSALNHMALGLIANRGNTLSAPTGGTAIFTDNAGAGSNGAAQYAPGAATVTFGWTDSAGTDYFGFIGVDVAPVSPFLLDNVSVDAIVAFSTRKLRLAYSGSAIRIRRLSDDAEQNIGFDLDGELDTAALASHIGVNDGRLRTIYDQSATGGANSEQTTDSDQPKVVASGVNYTQNGHVCFQTTSTGDQRLSFTRAQAQPFTIAMCFKLNDIDLGPGSSAHFTDGDTVGSRALIGTGDFATNTYQMYAGSAADFGGVLDTNIHAIFGVFNGASSELFVDGVSVIANSLGTNSMATQLYGSAISGAANDCDYCEYLVFPGVLSADDMALIRADWQAYWGVP